MPFTFFERSRHPQLLILPSFSKLVLATCKLPQRQRQVQAVAGFLPGVLGARSMTVSHPNVAPS